ALHFIQQGEGMQCARQVSFLLFAVAVLVRSTGLEAQVTTATLYGVVNDSTRAVIPGASITATHQGTGVSRDSVTDERGEFGLPAGADPGAILHGVRLNGVGAGGTGITVDGTEANSNPEGRALAQYGGQNQIDVISIEAVQEVQVVKGVLPAEFGGVVGGQVN